MSVPCGQCIGCRLAKSRDWALRCVHEIKQHDENCFVTFTYAPEKLPAYGTLVPHHYQDFMKRLRRKLAPKKIRFFQCGEYGEKFQRPHHHAILFGFDPPDQRLHGYSNREPIFTSELLSTIWSHGECYVGTATFESAAYIARYCTKKINGDRAEAHYQRADQYTGELHPILPEYATMSRRPGIGGDHLDAYMDDVFPSDECVHNGRVLKPPRYYSDKFRNLEPDEWEKIRLRRKGLLARSAKDNTPERLQQREAVKIAQFNQLKRGYENG